MIAELGKVAKQLRERKGLTQTALAFSLDISQVHLSNFENGKSKPSLELIEKYKEIFGFDLNMLAWCFYGDVDNLPKRVQASAKRFQAVWKKHMEQQLESLE